MRSGGVPPPTCPAAILARAVTSPETASPPRPRAADRPETLRAEILPLPSLDPLALLATVPATRPSLLWQGPGEEAWVGIGRALSLAPSPTPALGSGGALPEGCAEALAEAAREAARSVEAPPESLRVFFAVAFDPAAAFGSGAEADRWRGFVPVEAFLPEALVRCGANECEALLVASPERLRALRAEVGDLAERAHRAAAGRLSPARSVRPREDVANLAIEWAEREHRARVVAALDTLCRSAREPAPSGGCLTKVVLAHAVEVHLDRPFAPAPLLAELGHAHPGCFLFAVRPAPGAPVFLGASPERLARVEGTAAGGRRVISGALAGSAPRGDTEAEDEALGRRLLASAKDLEEHAIVGDMIVGALEPLCLRVDRWIEPVLEKLATVQHLYTPISGLLQPGRGVLDAVAALHPTPAVGGMPRAGALRAIRELERCARGLYAGVIGWSGPDGRGDSAVAIRSALVDGHRARVFAGGGIVPTSDPDVEVDETRLKMAAVLGAMERAATGGAEGPTGDRER